MTIEKLKHIHDHTSPPPPFQKKYIALIYTTPHSSLSMSLFVPLSRSSRCDILSVLLVLQMNLKIIDRLSRTERVDFSWAEGQIIQIHQSGRACIYIYTKLREEICPIRPI